MQKGKITIIWAASVLALTVFTASCKSGAHPNQINAFDGDTYDSLVVAHTAIVSMRQKVSTQYPQYKDSFNTAAAGYRTAYASYTSFRVTPSDETQVSLAIANLTTGIVALEDAIQKDLKVSPTTAVVAKYHAGLSSRTAKEHISLATILADLQIAAAVAQTIPYAAPYGALASVVIQVAQEATTAIQAQAGKPIDLMLIQPVPAI